MTSVQEAVVRTLQPFVEKKCVFFEPFIKVYEKFCHVSSVTIQSHAGQPFFLKFSRAPYNIPCSVQGFLEIP